MGDIDCFGIPLFSFFIVFSILNKRASTHPNWCEDNYFLIETDEYAIGAVLDGCSTGLNSYFASTLMKYAFEKSCVVPTLPKPNYLEYTNDLLGNVWFTVIQTKDMLGVSDLHLLSTIVFFIYNKRHEELFVKFAGDGTIVVNGIAYTNDEKNAPDYLAYHNNWADFSKWNKTRRTEQFVNVETFAICTDGIDSFVNLKNPHISKQIAIDYLLQCDDFGKLSNQLNKKFNILTNRDEELKKSDDLYWWDIKDDITIIKYATL